MRRILQVGATCVKWIALIREWEQRNYDESRQKVGGKIRVFCLSATRDDILLWAHYADGHKGICIEFSPSSVDHADVIGQAEQVAYSTECSAIRLYASNPRYIIEQARRCVLTKAKSWEYEKEWRVVLIDSPRAEVAVPAGLITSVVMGCKIEPAKRKEIIRWCRGHQPAVKLSQAHLDERRYGLVFEEIA